MRQHYFITKMAAELLTLEELIDRATDLDNIGSNDDHSLKVANQINREIGGSSSAVKLLIQKLQLHQEVITLQALNVVEVCVKNCGVKFHNEVGKYKFINELIKLLSPKYDGDITPPTIKKRVTELLFSWYCGLPNEKKIAEAYRMLKQQGIIKHDPVDPEGRTPAPLREEATVFTEDGNQQLLQTLLTSTDPEDLHQANKLIKSMVKQEEERLDRVSKRVQELETVSNNVKLLDDMLKKFERNGGSSASEDMEIMHDLYESCLKLRPELFRLASRSMEDKDDAMAEILCASDELTQVIDSYKEKILLQKIDKSIQKPYNITTEQNDANWNSTNTNESSLLDFGFDSPTTTSNVDQQSQEQQQRDQQQPIGNSLLDEQFKLLGLDTLEPASTMTQPSVDNNPMAMGNQLSQNAWQQPFGLNQSNSTMAASQPMFQAPNPMQTSQQLIGAMRPPAPMGIMQPQPPVSAAFPNPQASVVVRNNVPAKQAPVKKRNDVLDFDVFSDFRTPTATAATKPNTNQQTVTNGDRVDGANQSALNYMLDTSNDSLSFKTQNTASPISNQANTFQAAPVPASNTSLLDNSFPSSVPPFQPQQPAQVMPSAAMSVKSEVPALQPPTPTPAVAPAQENYAVPLEALKPTEHAPISVYDKNGLRTFLNFVTDTRETANHNVIVTVLSTISTSISPVKDFSVQVAVPKAMRVKLQPATATEAMAFNPIVPAPPITQVMLIANPNKENVRLRFKVSYNLNGVTVTDSSSVDQIPVR